MMSLTPVTLAALALLLAVAMAQEVRNPPLITLPKARATTEFVRPRGDWGIQCQATSTPAAQYSWMLVKDGKLSPISPTSQNSIRLDASTGWLNITSYEGYKHDGTYMCKATVTFNNGVGQDTKAASFSPSITLEELRLSFDSNEFVKKTSTAEQYTHLSLPCVLGANAITQASDMSYGWYKGSKSNQINDFDNNRIYIDTIGALHFMWLKEEDSNKVGEHYKCGIGSSTLNVINLLAENQLTVTPVADAQPRAPTFITGNSGVPQAIYQKATLECIFAGYDPDINAASSPRIEWRDLDHNIIQNDNKFKISADTRRLEIATVLKEDEGEYSCIGINSAGKTKDYAVFLNITSRPQFVTKGPQDVTLSEGKDALFKCDAESLPDEPSAETPVWYINGMKTGSHNDINKFVVAPNQKSLEVKSVNKASDVLCVQCSIKNNYGTTWGDACLTVVLPIKLTYIPPAKQVIVQGDTIDFSYKVTADPQSGELSKEWYFKNATQGLDKPEYSEEVSDGINVDKTFLNTSKLTDDQYAGVEGVYTLKINNKDNSMEITVTVELNDPTGPVAPVVASAGFPMWIIGVILGILVLVLVIVIIVCCVCKRMEEGDYNVDKKEVGAGLDPKKELMEKGFEDYSRPNLDDYEDVPRQPYVPYDDVDAPLTGDDNKSLGEYSEEDEARLGFNEDGSFIGQYYKKDPSGPPPPNYENHSSIA